MGRADAYPLDRYLDASRTLSLDSYDWSRARQDPLPPDVERVMVFMLRIEAQTLFFVRDLLNSPTAYHPDISAFLAVWLYEEERHSRIFRRFLAQRGVHVPPGDRADVRRASSAGIREWVEGTFLSLAGKLSNHVIAVHMVWGAIQELSTINAYEIVGERSGHPFLKELCDSIAKDERRHFAFYYNQAARFLRPKAAHVFTRWALEKWWKPVGFGIHSPQHAHQMCHWLFGDEAGLDRMKRMDETMSKLPGFAGLHLFEEYQGQAKAYIAERKAQGLDFEDWVPVPTGDGARPAREPDAELLIEPA